MTIDTTEFPQRRAERVRVGDVTLEVTDWGGHRSDDCIVLAHPTGFLGAVWKPLLRRLRGLGVTSRLITYDQRGHGLSSKPDRDYEWQNFVDDTLGIFQHLGIRDALGVGHSAGATTLAGVAAADSTLLRRLVMVDPVLLSADLVPIIEEAEDNPMAARTRTRRMVWPSREALFLSYRRRDPYVSWTEEALRDYVDEGTFERPDGEIELLCPARAEASVYSNAHRFGAYERLAQVRAPVLVLRGEHSTTLDERRATMAVDALPNGRLVTVAGTTHFIPMERPDEVARLVVAELRAQA